MPLPYEFELDNSRLSLLEKIKPGDVCAEIGVFRGDFSEFMLKMDPSKLYLVDPWVSIMDIPARWHAIDQGELDLIKQNVVNKFSSDNRVEIIEKYSIDALDDFEDGSFDWIYLDANHSYSFIQQDLENWWTKLKTGGTMCGNAYQDDDAQIRLLDFGVIPAVDSFLEDFFDEIENFEIIKYQFVLTKK
ncbi:class I SAM-dependent methyltransferase [bacterium]|nr:class I SAM-dependent methyltransferase [bacterium]